MCSLHHLSWRSWLAEGLSWGSAVKHRLIKLIARLVTSSGILLKSGAVLFTIASTMLWSGSVLWMAASIYSLDLVSNGWAPERSMKITMPRDQISTFVSWGQLSSLLYKSSGAMKRREATFGLLIYALASHCLAHTKPVSFVKRRPCSRHTKIWRGSRLRCMTPNSSR